MPTKDPEKLRAIRRRFYEKNRDRVIAQNAVSRREMQAATRQYVREIKEAAGCAACSGSFPHYVLHFDHLADDKAASVSDLVNQGASRQRIDAEIAKCEVVCANCHAIRTWERANSANLSAC